MICYSSTPSRNERSERYRFICAGTESANAKRVPPVMPSETRIFAASLKIGQRMKSAARSPSSIDRRRRKRFNRQCKIGVPSKPRYKNRRHFPKSRSGTFEVVCSASRIQVVSVTLHAKFQHFDGIIPSLRRFTVTKHALNGRVGRRYSASPRFRKLLDFDVPAHPLPTRAPSPRC